MGITSLRLLYIVPDVQETPSTTCPQAVRLFVPGWAGGRVTIELKPNVADPLWATLGGASRLKDYNSSRLCDKALVVGAECDNSEWINLDKVQLVDSSEVVVICREPLCDC